MKRVHYIIVFAGIALVLAAAGGYFDNLGDSQAGREELEPSAHAGLPGGDYGDGALLVEGEDGRHIAGAVHACAAGAAGREAAAEVAAQGARGGGLRAIRLIFCA